MNKKETYITGAALIAIAILCFFAGVLNQKSRQCTTVKPDYQIVLQEHDYVIMDGSRVVGVLHQTGQLDSLILADNE